MPVPLGTRVGAYEIVAPLGAGGMGEVYRARDTRLDRDVALKILAETFASDPDRLMRFEREAKTLAALNHPQIAQIYGIEHGAIVMELVEGETLADRLARGPMPLDEAIAVATQIAEALEAAHDAGIVHRDLKPANVKVRPDGTVKVLDFGLAKAAGRTGQASGAEVLNSPTITSPAATMQGVILGTAAYMSPEQAKGKPVDKRADVWAFGCVLYEMLTGRRAFEGDDVSDTLAAILRGDPDWAKLPPLPRAVTGLLARCLERDARRRVSSMSTVRFVLETPADPQAGAAESRAVHARYGRRHVVLAAVAAAAVALLAALGYGLVAPALPPSPVLRLEIPMPDGQVLAFTRRMVDVSADGLTVAYVTDRDLFVRRLAAFEESRLSTGGSPATISSPTFSPDGEWIAFHNLSERAVKRVSVQGGVEFRVCETEAPTSMSWDATGILLALGGQGGIVRCTTSGGPPEQLVKAEEGESLLGPSLLPNRLVLFTAGRLSDDARVRWDRARIVAQPIGGGERRVIVDGGSDARVLDTGHLVYRVGGVLYAVGFDPQTLAVRGEPTAVLEGVRRSTSGPTQAALSRTGSLVYIRGPVGPGANVRVLSIADRAGALTPLPLEAGPYVHVRASRDGTRLALGTNDGSDASVWTYTMNGKSALQRLTLQGRNQFPIWSPDGQWIAFASDRNGQPGIYRQRADGTGNADRLTTAGDGEFHVPESWSPDGRFLAYAVQKGQTVGSRYALMVYSFDGRTAAPFGGVVSEQPTGATFSPDGRWIAYTATPQDENLVATNRGVFVQPFPATGAVFQVPRILIDFHPMWMRDGRELVFLASQTARVMAAVRLSGTDSLTFEPPSRFPAVVSGDRLSGEPRMFDLLPDGRLIGFVTPGAEGDGTPQIRVVVNWIEELKQRVAQ